MEKPVEFLIEKLKQLVIKFPEIQIKYEQSKYTHSHIIEVLPLSLYKDNLEYLNAETAIEDEFELNYPNEDILFISECSLTEIRNENILFDSTKKECA